MATTTPDGLQGLLAAVGVEGPIPSFPLADTQNNPLSIYLSYLAEAIVKLTECEPQVAYDSIQWLNEQGDLSVVLPRLRLQDVKVEKLAADLIQRFPASPLFDFPFQDNVNLRFIFSATTLARVLLPYIIDRGPSYGKDLTSGLREPDAPDAGRKKIVVEFSSPNLGQKFDGSHLRSTIIGAYIASLYEGMGWNVVRMNFLGDWGMHIGLLAVGWSRFGSEEDFRADPLRHLLDVYTQIDKLFKPEQEAAKKLRNEHQDTSVIESEGISGERNAFFKKMEDGDPDALTLWKRFREVYIAKYTDLYARLNIKFDDYSGESDVSNETVTEVEAILREKGVYEKSDESWSLDFSKDGLSALGRCILRFRNGTTSYLLRDICAVLERSRKYSFDKMIYVVSAKQVQHFTQISKALELMGYSHLAEKLEHVSFGNVQGLLAKEGSSGLLLGDILDQCQSAISGLLEVDPKNTQEFQGGDRLKVSDALGGIGLMAQDLSIRRGGNFPFDIAKMATTDGWTGLALEESYAKLSTKLNGAAIDRHELESTDYSLFEEKQTYTDVLRLLVQFPGIVKSSFNVLESSTVLTLLYRIVDSLQAVWDEEVENESSQAGGSQQVLAQLAFYQCVRQVLENGMRLVGLVPMTTETAVAPLEATEDITIEATEDGPVKATEDGPVEATEDGPVEATEDGPVEATEDGPVEATEGGPVEATEDTTSEAAEQAPLEAIEQVPPEATEQVPLEAAEQAPLEATEQAPLEATEQASLEATEHAPLEATEPASLEATEPAPLEATEHAPLEATEPAPLEATEPAPLEATEPAPLEATEHAPLEATEPAPLEATEQVPLEATEPAPLEATEHVSLKATEHAPLEATEQAPLEAAEHAPLEATEQAPLEATEQAPLEATEQAPLEATEHAPLEATEHAPLEATEHVSLEATEHAPLEATEQAPLEATEPAPLETTEQAPLEATEEAPVEVTAHALLEATEHASGEPEVAPLDPESTPSKAEDVALEPEHALLEPEDASLKTEDAPLEQRLEQVAV